MRSVHPADERDSNEAEKPQLFEIPAELDVYRPLVARLRNNEAVSQDACELVDRALLAAARPGFDLLVSLPRLRFEPFAHQIQAARRALVRMKARAILADEVGLGKTIEAGLILSELFVRRLVRRTLIVVPPGLTEQWSEELDQKFALPVVVHDGKAWERRLHPWEAPIIIASLATIRREPWRSDALAVSWDLVIFDEAHRLKNPSSASAKFSKQIRAVRLLLLTATPVENRLDDLFQLVSLVRPGHFGTLPEFRRRHGTAAPRATDAPHALSVHEIDTLRARMRDVMIRHRRSEVALMLPRRLAETIRIAPHEDEAALYRAISERVRQTAHGAPSNALLGLRALQRLAGSNPEVLAPALRRHGWEDLASSSAALPKPGTKARVLAEVINRHRSRGEKVIVFTSFRQTLAHLADHLATCGIPAASYHGSLSRKEKSEVMRSFSQESPVLLTTEAAGEGRNLQFCHAMINFDLPWNPMQIEQRLGRIHRIGQTHDVLLTNLVNKGTVEDVIFEVLQAKINLFELVVGELDIILGRVDDEFDFESSIFEAHVASGNEAELRARMEAIGDRVAHARSAYLESRALNDDLLPVEQSA